jgi:predicted transcriptional regulator
MITISDARILSAAIRAARGALGWSQQDLADKADVSLPTVARLEAALSSPKLETVSRMIGALEKAGVEFDWQVTNGFGIRVTLRKR